MNARDPLERVRAALHRYARRVTPMLAGLKDAEAIRRVLRDESVRTLEELGYDVAHDPMAQARLDYAVADALDTLARLTSDEGGDS
jgi:hypothetical protein